MSFIDEIKILLSVTEVKKSSKRKELLITTTGKDQEGIKEYLKTFSEIKFQEEERDLFSEEVVLRYKIN